MFTGLVEAIGTVRESRWVERVLRLSIESLELVPELALGQSVSVGGVCLTVIALRGGAFDVEMMPETASRTRLSSLTRGRRVNLERAMTLGGRLDGHLVLGHVDGTASLENLSGPPRTKEARFRASKGLKSSMRYVVAKGSVAVDGVSLTVIEADGEGFSVGLIPATLESTALGLLGPGDFVNVETDIVGKYVERLLNPLPDKVASGSKAGGLTLEEMYQLGY
ncbi:MAG: riboflavin synthase [Synergistaceae bacterium]|jgi:riboflavin synthase|nr:riboflavin synthase [Synergistaceae bacterium]